MISEIREFNNIMSQIDGAYHELSVKLGISDSEMGILYGILNEGNGCNQSLLYRKSGLGKTTVNSAIRKMEKEGLLYLEAGEGRNTRVFLTDAGKQLSRVTAERQAAMEDEIFMSWSEEDRKQYVELNRRYLGQFLQKIRDIEEK